MRIPYGPEEDEIIRHLWPCNSAADVGALIDRSPSSVDNRAQKLGLHKLPTYVRRMSATFKPGGTPWNKGCKGWEAGGRSVQTRFKRGRPAYEARNYQPIGTERVTKDGYLERKVTDDPALVPARRWVGVHRLVWEAANGPLPPGHVVVFKPGRRTLNVDEITLDRLECISRAENMRRNSYWNRLPPDVARLVQLRGALNRKINNRTRKNEEQGQ